jgi:CheY-like chemotaxis protein
MKILVIDDDAGNRRLIDRMLGRLPDIEVFLADSGADGLKASEAHPIEFVLLDISMPGMDGIEVCARLRAMPAYAQVPIFACTAHAATRDHEQFLKQGFSGVLTKPFLIEELYRAIGRDPATR